MTRVRLAAVGSAVALSVSLAVAAPRPAAADEQTPFNATIVEAFTLTACPLGNAPLVMCLNATGSGKATHLGNVTSVFHVVLDLSREDAAGTVPVSKAGTLTAANGDRLDIHATGTFSFTTLVADYTYTVAGGTGRFSGATGSGTHRVPAPTTFNGVSGTGPEFFSGTLSSVGGANGG